MRLKIPFQLIFGHWHDHICEKFCVLFTNFSFTVYNMKNAVPEGRPYHSGFLHGYKVGREIERKKLD